MANKVDSKLIQNMVFEYNELRDRAKVIKNRMEVLSKSIKEYLTENVTPDSKGSYYDESNDFIFGNQAKKSVKLNEEKARVFFTNKGLLEKVADTKIVINEDKVSKLLETKEITQEELESLVDIKVTYSIDIKQKVKEENEEVTYEIASSKKPQRKLPTKRR